MEIILKAIVKSLEQQSKWLLFTLSCLLIFLLAYIDYQTSFEVNFSSFYLIPILISSWGISKRIGVSVSFISALTWLITNQLAGQVYSHWFIPYWNLVNRLSVYLLIVFLVSALKKSLEKEKVSARTDFLTGAFNRRGFYECVNLEIFRCHRYQRPFTIVYLDLDNFKIINDLLGHQTGDIVLQKVVGILKNQIRAIDIVARLGGDEFSLLLLEVNQVLAPKIVFRINEELLKEMHNNNWLITFSIGVVTYLKLPPSVNEVIAQADQLMYEVKRLGKNAIKYEVCGN